MRSACVVSTLLLNFAASVAIVRAAPPITDGPKTPTVQPSWTFDGVAPVVTDPAISADGSTGFYTTSASVVFALDYTSGSLLWSVSLWNSTNGSPALTPDGRTLVLGCGNDVAALSATNSSEVWSVFTGNTVVATPILSKTKPVTYVGNLNGTMYAINTTNGHVVWNASSTGAVFAQLSCLPPMGSSVFT